MTTADKSLPTGAFKAYIMASRGVHMFLTVCWLLAAFPVLIPAQSNAVEKSGSQPTATTAPVPVYKSIFDHYYGYDEIQSGSWREANDAVGLAGSGHSHSEKMAPSNDLDEIESLDMSMQEMPPISLPDHKSSHQHNHGPKP